ncbi:MAG: beta-propeller fold lactonase family protein [Terriglobales bacterium]
MLLRWTLILVLCAGVVDGCSASGRENASRDKGHEVLYGFAIASLNISATARINRNTGGFNWASTGPVPFFANSAAVASSTGFLYISNSFINGVGNNGSQIFGYTINQAKGTLTPIVGSPFFLFPPPISIQGLATTPDGQFLYGADDSGHIFAFRLDRVTGVPTSVPGSPFTSGANSQLVVDPTGKFLYASEDIPPGVLAFTIDQSGALSPVPGSPFAIPDPSTVPNSEPYGIVDTGSFVYVALSANNKIAAFSVDSGTGSLTRVPGSPFPAGNSPALFALANSFLYVVNPGDGTVSGYRIDAGSGALTPVPGSPFGAGGETLATDSFGMYLYLGTFKGIQGYNIDSATGSLTLGSAKLGEAGALWLTIVDLHGRDAQ